MYGAGMRSGMFSPGMMGAGGMGMGMGVQQQQGAAGGMSPFQGVMSVLGIVGGMAQFADAALEAVHVFLSLSARLCDRLGWARQELSGAVAAAAAAAAAARSARSSASSSSRLSPNLRRLLMCAAVSFSRITCCMRGVTCIFRWQPVFGSCGGCYLAEGSAGGAVQTARCALRELQVCHPCSSLARLALKSALQLALQQAA